MPHQATTLLACRYETVGVEDLNVAGMLRNRGLAQSLSDQSLGRAWQQLGSKTAWRGGRLLVANRFFPSSKTSSAWGTVNAKRSLAERI
jgi:putative transposase